jgi:hypothetical protein
MPKPREISKRPTRSYFTQSPDRPPCPSCGKRPCSEGLRWRCANPACGRSWRKFYRGTPVFGGQFGENQFDAEVQKF